MSMGGNRIGVKTARRKDHVNNDVGPCKQCWARLGSRKQCCWAKLKSCKQCCWAKLGPCKQCCWAKPVGTM